MPDSTATLELLEELKRTYLAELPSRVDNLESLILALGRDDSFSGGYAELYRQTHSLKGSGGTYGFGIISTICHRLEDHLQLVEGDVAKFSEDERQRWLDHIDVMRHAIELLSSNLNATAELEKELDAIRADVFTKNYRVMIVEKSKSTVLLCQKVLDSLPVQVSVEHTGYSALDRLLAEKFDLLVSGMEVDKLNGVALIGALRLSSSPSRDIKSILITSKPQLKLAACVKPDWVLMRDETLAEKLYESARTALSASN